MDNQRYLGLLGEQKQHLEAMEVNLVFLIEDGEWDELQQVELKKAVLSMQLCLGLAENSNLEESESCCISP